MRQIGNYKSKSVLFGFILIIFSAQMGCNYDQATSPNSNANAAHVNNGNNSVNSAASNKGETAPNSPVTSGNGNYSINSETLTERNEISQHPVFENENYSRDTPTDGGGENTSNLPGIQSQSHNPNNAGLNETERLPVSPVMADLEIAIDRWSDAEAAGYGLKMNLISLWRRKNPTIKYNPVGIDVLTGKIRERPAFANCRRAKKLNRNMFHENGITTVGHLYDYLEPCGGYANFK